MIVLPVTLMKSKFIPDSVLGTYGKLYNWYAIDTGKLAPTGWHIPTDTEWTTLSTYLGGESVAGGKMKEIGTSHWDSPNTDATNLSGFTGVGGGFRHNTVFYHFKSSGYYWSSTPYSSSHAWRRTLNASSSELHRSSSMYRYYGGAVRCMTTTDPEASTVTDIDGNVYSVVQIGTQWWMANNLRVEHYTDGQLIPHLAGDDEWDSMSTHQRGA